jgi:CheY-like chemotaxis protein
MKVCVAEDDGDTLWLLEKNLQGWGYQVQKACDGNEAWGLLREADGPKLAILDWGMPGLDGVEVCRRLREERPPEPPYLILLTGRQSTGDLIAGLESGANDYVTKPFDQAELRARVRAGQRMLALQHTLATRIDDLQGALDEIRRLHGFMPICSYCKKIRDNHNCWDQVEACLTRHSALRFSHGICADCWDRVVRPLLKGHGIEEASGRAGESFAG